MPLRKKDLDGAFEFGEIATRFCIQYLGYSLVGCGGSKVIITAQDNCAKKFAKYLQDEEYWIMRLPKVYYVPPKLRSIGYFKELSVLPTNDLYYGNDEYLPNINMPAGYAKVLK